MKVTNKPVTRSEDPVLRDTAYKGIEKWVTGAIRQRVLVLVALILATGLGVYTFFKLRIDAVPDISNIQVTVTANARGLAPQEAEQYITYPIENALQGMPRLTELRSTSKYALAQVTAVFEDGTDIYWARQQVSERLAKAQDKMPKTGVSVDLGPIATGLGEIFQFEVRGPGYSLAELRDILDWQIKPILKSSPGVEEVQSMGGQPKEYQVWVDPAKLRNYGLTLHQVMTALEMNNANAGGGYTVVNGNQILLRAEGLLSTPEDIGSVVISSHEVASGPEPSGRWRNIPEISSQVTSHGGAIRVRDIGSVVIGKKLSQSIVTQNGQGETTIGIVVMRKGENSEMVVQGVKEKLAELAPGLPKGVKIVPFYDRSVLINSTIETVWHNLVEGAILVVLVLLLLLGNLRGGIIAASAIPLAMMGAVGFLVLTNTSGNLLSLGAIDFGILIDGSVVMIENILRRLAEDQPEPEERLAVVQSAAAEVARPVLFAVGIIIVVYLPILFLTGVAGKTFQPMALTVVFGLITALFIALFITPVLAYFLIRKAPEEKETFILRAIRPVYERTLQFCTQNPLLTASVALAVFVVSLLPIPFLGSEFIPSLKEGSLVLTVNRPISVSLQESAKQTTLMEKVVREFPEVETTVARTGHSEEAFDPMGPDETDFFIILKPQSEWKNVKTQQELEDLLSKRLAETVPGAAIAFGQPIEQRMNELVAGAKGDVAVRVFGSDLKVLAEVGNKVSKALVKVQGSSDIKVSQVEGLPVVTTRLNRPALSAYGVDAQEVLDTIASAVAGNVVGTIYQGKPRYDLSVRFAPQSVLQIDDLKKLPVSTRSGQTIPLGQVATVTLEDAPAQIDHRSGDRNLLVQLNVSNRDLGGFVAEAQKVVGEQVQMPAGYRLEWGGQFKNLQEAQARLFVLVPVALLLIFTLLYATYGSFRPGLLIFLNIPLALSGGLIALALRGMPLSVTAGVGFIALFGVAVLNGVVLVSTIRKYEQEEGLTPAEAAYKGATLRLRPVLMTALVASLGFLPMAVATSIGAEVQRPLATVVIGGLITATALTLLVLPTLYPVICGKDGLKTLFPKRKKPILHTD
ncbi:MAG: CusA/CzcA family heavy metal efflux RND transporter [Gloeobacterales cyanobacterium]